MCQQIHPLNATCANYFMWRYEKTLVYLMLNLLQWPVSAQALVYIISHTYGPEHICMPHHTCMFHCTNNVVYMWIQHYCKYSQNKTTNCNYIYHAIIIYISATKVPFKYHICHLHYEQIWDYCVHIYNSSELNATNSVTRNISIHAFYITSICPWTNMPATLHMYALLHFHYSLNIDPTLLHKSIKINRLLHLFMILVQNICQQ